MKTTYFVGVDTSRLTLDLALVKDGKVIHQATSSNDKKGINEFLNHLKKRKIESEDVIFCMEHTGIYNNPFLSMIEGKNLNIWLECPNKIRLSQGIQRGKNDRIDAYRIAQYAWKHRSEVKRWEPPRKVIVELRQLIRMRERLLKSIIALKRPLTDGNSFIDKALLKTMTDHCKKTITSAREEVKAIEQRIKELIQSDEELKRLYKLVSSVPGVGMIIAVNTIVRTNEFKFFNDPKKFACYSGVVPYDHKSGTSIRGKSRVSHMANKKMKALFHMAAVCCTSFKGDLQDYFRRKVAQGKDKMSVINAIRNKIIHRIFAVVRHNRLYEIRPVIKASLV